MGTSTIPFERVARSVLWVTFAALVAGLIAGTVDIGAASFISGYDATVILRFIAGGLQGGAAVQGGTASAWLGLLLQWSMSILISVIFGVAALRLRWLTARWVTAGLAYGVVVFVMMNYVVMPLSAWHRINHFSPASFLGNMAAMLQFGLIVAFTTRCLGVGVRRR